VAHDWPPQFAFERASCGPSDLQVNAGLDLFFPITEGGVTRMGGDAFCSAVGQRPHFPSSNASNTPRVECVVLFFAVLFFGMRLSLGTRHEWSWIVRIVGDRTGAFLMRYKSLAIAIMGLGALSSVYYGGHPEQPDEPASCLFVLPPIRPLVTVSGAVTHGGGMPVVSGKWLGTANPRPVI
jgi:hypothetical protein